MPVRIWAISVMLTLLQVFEPKLRRYDTNCRHWKRNYVPYIALNYDIAIRENCTQKLSQIDNFHSVSIMAKKMQCTYEMTVLNLNLLKEFGQFQLQT